jgi:hypothetical protein
METDGQEDELQGVKDRRSRQHGTRGSSRMLSMTWTKHALVP